MSHSDAGGAGGVAAAIAANNTEAIKVFGAIVHVESSDFASIVFGMPDPLIVAAEGGVFKTRYRYLISYKGLVFTTKSDAALQFQDGALIIRAKKIRIPD
jgi:hypothetical protein